MDLGVRGIPELVQKDGSWNFRDEARRPRDGVAHENPRSQNDFRAEVSEKRDPLGRHGFWHRQDQPVTADRRDEGEPDAGVAAGRLDDRRPGPQDPAALGVLDQRDAEAVLDAPAGISHLQLRDYPTRKPAGEAFQLHHRGPADGRGEVTKDHASPSRGTFGLEAEYQGLRGLVDLDVPGGGARLLNVASGRHLRNEHLGALNHGIDVGLDVERE